MYMPAMLTGFLVRRVRSSARIRITDALTEMQLSELTPAGRITLVDERVYPSPLTLEMPPDSGCDLLIQGNGGITQLTLQLHGAPVAFTGAWGTLELNFEGAVPTHLSSLPTSTISLNAANTGIASLDLSDLGVLAQCHVHGNMISALSLPAGAPIYSANFDACHLPSELVDAVLMWCAAGLVNDGFVALGGAGNASPTAIGAAAAADLTSRGWTVFTN